MRKIRYFIIGLITFVGFNLDVSAGAILSVSDTKVNVGSSFKTTVNLNNVASWEIHVSSSGPVKDCFIDASDSTENGANGSKTYSVTCITTGVGNVNIKLSGNVTNDSFVTADISDSRNVSVVETNSNSVGNSNSNGSSNNTSGSNSRPSTNSNSNTNTKPSNNSKPNVTTPRVLSSINYLSSLSIDGVSLNPVFDKNNTEYEVVLENGTNKVNVIGERESNTSYVTGLGEVPVSEGVNFINVVVTAENGAKRTYIIKATVLEEKPIIVNVNDKSMTLVRKVEAMPSASDYYVSSTIKINDEDIPCYVSEITGYTLVGLKGNDGNIGLYRYDKDSNSYFEYNEFGFNFLRISLLDSLTVPKDYTVGSIKINEQDVTAYIKEGEYPLIYGVNLENGVESFYSYDEEENTIQRFSVLDDSDNYDKYYPYIIIGLIGFIIIQFIIMIIVVISKNKKQRKMLLNKLDTKTEFERKVSSDVKLTDIVGNSNDSSLENKVVSKKDKKKINKKLKDDDMYKF